MSSLFILNSKYKFNKQNLSDVYFDQQQDLTFLLFEDHNLRQISYKWCYLIRIEHHIGIKQTILGLQGNQVHFITQSQLLEQNTLLEQIKTLSIRQKNVEEHIYWNII